MTYINLYTFGMEKIEEVMCQWSAFKSAWLAFNSRRILLPFCHLTCQWTEESTSAKILRVRRREKINSIFRCKFTVHLRGKTSSFFFFRTYPHYSLIKYMFPCATIKDVYFESIFWCLACTSGKYWRESLNKKSVLRQKKVFVHGQVSLQGTGLQWLLRENV